MFSKIKSFLLFISVIISSNCFGQDGESFSSRIFTGGNVSLQFGTETIVQIAPIVGYKVTERFTPGIGAQYMYYKYSDSYYNFSTSIYGGSIFARYYLFEELFAHAEIEMLNLGVYDINNAELRKTITGILVGGGYRQPIGESSSFNIMILFDINQERYSPYQNPIIRVGFGIGI